MTRAQADKLIKSNSTVQIIDKYGDTGTFKFSHRERSKIYTDINQLFNLSDIEILRVKP